MTKDSVAVLEVGSQKITCVIGQHGVNRTFLIKSIAERDYDGFSDRAFFDISSLAEAVKGVISETSENSRMLVDKLYVSVPGEFTRVKTKENTLAFKRKHRIKKHEMEEFCNGFDLSDNSSYVITDKSALYYELDDNRRVANPENIPSFKLGGMLCYVLTDKYYINLLTKICKNAGVKDVQFISETIAEAKYLIPREEKDIKRVVIDVGYLTTNVFVTYGNGVLYQKAFSYGGGYITASLMEKLDIDFDVAEMLKRKINLGYDVNIDGSYRISVNDVDYIIPMQKANFTVRFCLDKLAENIEEVLRDCPVELKLALPIGLTGGGISYMRGSKEYLGNRLEIPVNILSLSIPYMNKTHESACLSILDEAISRNRK